MIQHQTNNKENDQFQYNKENNKKNKEAHLLKTDSKEKHKEGTNRNMHRQNQEQFISSTTNLSKSKRDCNLYTSNQKFFHQAHHKINMQSLMNIKKIVSWKNINVVIKTDANRESVHYSLFQKRKQLELS